MNYLVLKIAGILERVNPFIADDIVKILSKRENRGDRIIPASRALQRWLCSRKALSRGQSN
jgi:hypothetical protein